MTKVNDMTEKTTLALTDLLYLLSDPAGTPLDKKITIATLISALNLKYINLLATNGNCGTGTIAASAATTTISNTSVTANSRIVIFPTSAGAAADVGSATGVYVSAKTAGTSFTLTHPNNATAAKTFDYLIFN